MDENRTRILNMLKANQISVEEAEQLLAALNPPAEAPVALKDNRGRKNKKLRVVVDTEEEDSKAKVNVNLPVSLVRTLGPIIIKNLPAEAKAEIEKSGIDLAAIMEGIEEFIDSGIEEDIVNVDVGGKDNAKVRVYVE